MGPVSAKITTMRFQVSVLGQDFMPSRLLNPYVQDHFTPQSESPTLTLLLVTGFD